MTVDVDLFITFLFPIMLHNKLNSLPPRVTGRYCNGESTIGSPPPPRRDTGRVLDRVDPAESIDKIILAAG